MRFKLLHFTSFVPILSRIVADPVGLQIAWCLYLFFTYVLLENKRWNNRDIDTWYRLQRIAEICMIVALALARWVSPWIAPIAFLLVQYKTPHDRVLRAAATLLLITPHDYVQTLGVGLSLAAQHVPTSKIWSKAALRRISIRFVQVALLFGSYQTNKIRAILVVFGLVLKAVVWQVAEDNKDLENIWEQTSERIELDLHHLKEHTL